MSEIPEPANAAEESMLSLTPHIGAFVLETLTLGMYGEPRHTLREYVQNSFDSIRAARRTGFLNERGRVTITLQGDQVAILDNGLGVSAPLVWKTLTSIGASKKDREQDAGFRGIGRLAGMAYCDELVFRTTFPGETVVSSVVFDCVKLMEAMGPDEGGDIELAKLLRQAIKLTVEEETGQEDKHFFEVIMKGLGNAPDSLTNEAEIRAYLSQTVPVSFETDWSHRALIESEYQAYFGAPLETIDVRVVDNRDTNADRDTNRVFKPYGDTYRHAKGTMQLRSVEFIADDESRYWGWVGRLSKSAAVTDRETRGLRVRARNIQVDGTEIFETLFSEVKPSYGRFSSYYIGEIHLNPKTVVPNARRDGFEETPSWVEIKSSLVEVICRPLASEAYDASQQGQSDVTKLVEDIDKLVERSSNLANSSRTSYDQVVDLMNTAKRLRRRAASALKEVTDLDETAVAEDQPEAQRLPALQDAARSVASVETQARMLIGRYIGEEEQLEGLRARIRQEVLKELLDVVNAYVAPREYQKIRRHLLKSG